MHFGLLVHFDAEDDHIYRTLNASIEGKQAVYVCIKVRVKHHCLSSHFVGGLVSCFRSLGTQPLHVLYPTICHNTSCDFPKTYNNVNKLVNMWYTSSTPCSFICLVKCYVQINWILFSDTKINKFKLILILNATDTFAHNLIITEHTSISFDYNSQVLDFVLFCTNRYSNDSMTIYNLFT